MLEFGYRNPRHVFELPICVFQTQSLVELRLELVFEFELKLLDDELIFINLPSLKILHMYLYDSHRPLMRSLLKSCPLLERLWLSLFLNEEEHIIDIVTPNLKHLRFQANEGHPADCKVWIDAPKLEIFEMRGPSMAFNFVKDLKLLQTARVFLYECGFSSEGELINRLLSLFQGISCVRSLECYFPGFYNVRHLCNPDLVTLPIFRNLFHLQFTCATMKGNNFIPRCLLSKLKSLEILNLKLYDDNDDAIRLLQDVLTNATVLEDLYVCVDFHSGKIEKKLRMREFEFCKKLFMLPRSSLSCQIEFSGKFFQYFEEDFVDGELRINRN